MFLNFLQCNKCLMWWSIGLLLSLQAPEPETKYTSTVVPTEYNFFLFENHQNASSFHHIGNVGKRNIKVSFQRSELLDVTIHFIKYSHGATYTDVESKESDNEYMEQSAEAATENSEKRTRESFRQRAFSDAKARCRSPIPSYYEVEREDIARLTDTQRTESSQELMSGCRNFYDFCMQETIKSNGFNYLFGLKTKTQCTDTRRNMNGNNVLYCGDIERNNSLTWNCEVKRKSGSNVENLRTYRLQTNEQTEVDPTCVSKSVFALRLKPVFNRLEERCLFRFNEETEHDLFLVHVKVTAWTINGSRRKMFEKTQAHNIRYKSFSDFDERDVEFLFLKIWYKNHLGKNAVFKTNVNGGNDSFQFLVEKSASRNPFRLSTSNWSKRKDQCTIEQKTIKFDPSLGPPVPIKSKTFDNEVNEVSIETTGDEALDTNVTLKIDADDSVLKHCGTKNKVDFNSLILKPSVIGKNKTFTLNITGRFETADSPTYLGVRVFLRNGKRISKLDFLFEEQNFTLALRITPEAGLSEEAIAKVRYEMPMLLLISDYKRVYPMSLIILDEQSRKADVSQDGFVFEIKNDFMKPFTPFLISITILSVVSVFITGLIISVLYKNKVYGPKKIVIQDQEPSNKVDSSEDKDSALTFVKNHLNFSNRHNVGTLLVCIGMVVKFFLFTLSLWAQMFLHVIKPDVKTLSTFEQYLDSVKNTTKEVTYGFEKYQEKEISRQNKLVETQKFEYKRLLADLNRTVENLKSEAFNHYRFESREERIKSLEEEIDSETDRQNQELLDNTYSFYSKQSEKVTGAIPVIKQEIPTIEALTINSEGYVKDYFSLVRNGLDQFEKKRNLIVPQRNPQPSTETDKAESETLFSTLFYKMYTPKQQKEVPKNFSSSEDLPPLKFPSFSIFSFFLTVDVLLWINRIFKVAAQFMIYSKGIKRVDGKVIKKRASLITRAPIYLSVVSYAFIALAAFGGFIFIMVYAVKEVITPQKLVQTGIFDAMMSPIELKSISVNQILASNSNFVNDQLLKLNTDFVISINLKIKEATEVDLKNNELDWVLRKKFCDKTMTLFCLRQKKDNNPVSIQFVQNCKKDLELGTSPIPICNDATHYGSDDTYGQNFIQRSLQLPDIKTPPQVYPLFLKVDPAETKKKKEKLMQESVKYIVALNNVLKKYLVVLLMAVIFFILVNIYSKVALVLLEKADALRIRNFRNEKMNSLRDFQLKK